MLEDILKKLDITGTPARIYTKLVELGPSSARRLAEVLSLPRPSVYDGLKILKKENFIVEREEDNKKIFSVNNPNILSRNLEEKIHNLENINETFKKILPQLTKQVETIEPKIRFFSGEKGIWKMLREVLWGKNMIIYGMWPIKEMIKLLGQEEFEKFHSKREKNNIWINIIWPHNKIVAYPWLKSNKKQLREIRIAPENTIWNMGYWILDDKVLFVSSRKELFGFIIQSKDFAGLMKTQFNAIWKQSKSQKICKK